MEAKKIDSKELERFFNKANWYHTIRSNNLTTSGVYDIDKVVHNYGFDEDYKGRTVLEVGPSDGYFSFLFKKRGAEIVTAIDSNTYDGQVAINVSNKSRESYEHKYSGYKKEYDDFKYIYDYYGVKTSNKLLVLSKIMSLDVNYLNGSIYNLDNVKNHDVVFCGDLLEHLRDPISAIEQLYNKTNHKCIITVSTALTTSIRNIFYGDSYLRYVGHHAGGNFFQLSYGAVRNMCLSAGFSKVELVSNFNLKNNRHKTINKHFVIHAWK
jgi:hypothetical protein